MLSFGFEDGKHLALSVETRLPEGVEQEVSLASTSSST